jgi:hypothetical protein
LHSLTSSLCRGPVAFGQLARMAQPVLSDLFCIFRVIFLKLFGLHCPRVLESSHPHVFAPSCPHVPDVHASSRLNVVLKSSHPCISIASSRPRSVLPSLRPTFLVSSHRCILLSSRRHGVASSSRRAIASSWHPHDVASLHSVSSHCCIVVAIASLSHHWFVASSCHMSHPPVTGPQHAGLGMNKPPCFVKRIYKVG